MVIRPLCECLLRPWPFIVFSNSICSGYDSICQDCKTIDQHEGILCRRGSRKNFTTHFLSYEVTSLASASSRVTWLGKISLISLHFQFWSVWTMYASNSATHRKRSLVPHASIPQKFLQSYSWQGRLSASARSSQFPSLDRGYQYLALTFVDLSISFPSLFGNFRYLHSVRIFM